MYNGIGLQTARGSGTNGYVQRNLSHLRPRDPLPAGREKEAPPRHTQPDAQIVAHEQRRKIEIQCIELQDELEEKGLPEDEIQQRVASLRQSLRARLEAAPNRFAKPTHAEAKQLRPSDTHMRGAAKEVESQKMQRALRIRSDYEEGQAFDHELQEQRRMQRIEEREQRREETRRLREERASRLAEDERSARRRAPTDRDDQRRAPSYRPYERERSRSQSPEPYPGDSSRHRRPVSPYQEDAPLAPSRTPSPPPIAREARAL